jgi:hypothetical protein
MPYTAFHGAPKETLHPPRLFKNVSALSLGGLALKPWQNANVSFEFSQHERLGRVAAGKVDLKTRPDWDSPDNGVLYADAVVPWLREVVGIAPYRTNQRWVETPDGYIWAPYLQPVQNRPNIPEANLPETNLGGGMWVEVSVPFVNLMLDNPPPRSPALKETLELGLRPRLYYSQIMWIDAIKIDDQGLSWYRVNEPYGSYGDIYWARAEAYRPITREEMAPIRPEVEDKRVVVDVDYQTSRASRGKMRSILRASLQARYSMPGGSTSMPGPRQSAGFRSGANWCRCT